MPYQAVNGADLFFEEVGAGEPILMHHGYTGSHDAWLELVVPKLQDRYRCIVMDARGAGDSSHPEDGYTLEQYPAPGMGVWAVSCRATSATCSRSTTRSTYRSKPPGT